MAQTARYRNQHDELAKILSEISAANVPTDLARDAGIVSRLIDKLSALLIVHLTLEDKSFYPRLRNHGDASVRAMSDQFEREMGGLRAAFESFSKKWSNTARIQSNAVVFAQETTSVIALLTRRIERENSELYALVDRLDIQVSIA